MAADVIVSMKEQALLSKDIAAMAQANRDGGN
jgi:hypothetical protein